ncbi:MAG: hypothetical protein KJO80_08600 [Gammaproteobacteria bacterium]|nr:hypothetical protein [Gammaproteobacteria bacterium]
MNKLFEDKLASDFSRLRDEERQAAPSYRNISRASSGSLPRPGVWRPASLALVVSVILITAIILMSPISFERTDDFASNQGDDFLDLETMLVKEMPTDFLLDTPWYQLADMSPEISTPEFNYDVPLYEYPEDQSHEL